MQQREHSTLYATQSSLSSKWNSNKPTQSYPKFQVEFTQANSQCSRREAAEPRLDHVDTDRPRQTDLDSDITFFNFWTVLRLPGGENMTGLDGLNSTEIPRHNRKESSMGWNWPSRSGCDEMSWGRGIFIEDSK
ncbi:hypothetical protein F2Q70_00036733 [Brassica cretica]|uniref:Uncharacterized protein n=1 Tax=Brassica cretica TaxID=69181 RepID=A0A8S9JT62_BRACR|nr:hypothetical protein F2Q70_00036733 [Brassica cretica]